MEMLRAGHENTQIEAVLTPVHRVRELFHEHYQMLRQASEGIGRLGVAIGAVEPGRVAARLWLPARFGAPALAVIGRHERADIRLPDSAFSLRHLALLIWRRNDGEPSIQLFDLRSRRPFSDEWGSPLVGLVSEGPMFLSCGRYGLFCLPTGEGASWPDNPEDGWSCVPDRVYLHEHRAPLPCAPLLAPQEMLAGELQIDGSRERQIVRIGIDALERGILLGRDERCDGSLLNRGISRVHLLIVKQAGRILAVDTLSRNGTRMGRLGRGRLFDLTDGGSLTLAETLTLRWYPA